MNSSQKEILTYLRTVESAGIEEIYRNISSSYYHNYKFYMGQRLSRMVSRGYIERVKPGVFMYKSETPMLNKAINQDRPTLFG